MAKRVVAGNHIRLAETIKQARGHAIKSITRNKFINEKETKMKKVAIGVVALLAVAACAQQPAAIVPVSMGDAYANVSCSKAKQLYLKESAKVPTLIAAQKQAVTGDTVGVFLIGVPISSLSGANIEGEIAATKGKLLALGARLDVCGTSPAQNARTWIT